MGIFDRIKDAIFGRAEAAPAEATTTATETGTVAPPVPGTAETATAGSASASAGAASPIDVTAILDKAVADSGQKLDWRHSIVDLMKALGLDSSLQARKELADDLGYSGDKSDSATMNIWLHKQVLKKLSENGGKVPADLLG